VIFASLLIEMLNKHTISQGYQTISKLQYTLQGNLGHFVNELLYVTCSNKHFKGMDTDTMMSYDSLEKK